MNSRRNVLLRISGLCGVITPLAAFSCVLLAIGFSPSFSWTNNALSDLGVMPGVTSVLFNFGLVVSGALALTFASGLSVFFKKGVPGQVGAFILAADSLALAAIGIFPENVKPMHLYASVLFFALFPLAMFSITATFLLASNVKMGLFTILLAMFAAAVWIAQFVTHYVNGAAIPETLSALAASMWTVVLGFNLLRAPSQ